MVSNQGMTHTIYCPERGKRGWAACAMGRKVCPLLFLNDHSHPSHPSMAPVSKVLRAKSCCLTMKLVSNSLVSSMVL